MSRPLLLSSIHLLGCLAFLALPYLLAEDGFAKLAELSSNVHEQRDLMSYLLTIGFFYVNFYWLLPRLFFTRKYLFYSASVVGCFLVMQGMLVIVNQQRSRPPPRRPPSGSPVFSPRPDRPPMPLSPPGSPFPNDRPPSGKPRYDEPPGRPSEIGQTFFLFLEGLLLSMAIRINNRWRETERERLNTELSYLKAQINPHFLFNTLNSIYSLALERSSATADAIVQLSQFLRYVIAEARQDKVDLSHELAYIGHYIALQQLRLADTVLVNYSTHGNPSGHQIAPLLLISFIENAFKYGVSPQEPSCIDIRIEISAHQLYGYVFNRKVQVTDASAVSSGIGLTNTRARLQLLYPGHHQLLIADQPDSFTVELYLTLP